MADAIRKLTHTAAELDEAIGILLEVYTREETDKLLARKVDAVPGSGLISDAERMKLSTLKNYDDTELRTDVSKAADGVALNRSTLGYWRKNLLKNTAVSKTQNGVTFTVNEDGTVSVNGTASAGTTLPIGQVEIEKGRTYAVSGCPAGGSSLTYRLDVRYYKNGTITTIGSALDIGEGTAVTLPDDADDNRLLIYIRIGDGTNTENLTFCPMLRYAEITNDAYEPYKPSVEERLAALESALVDEKSGAK